MAEDIAVLLPPAHWDPYPYDTTVSSNITNVPSLLVEGQIEGQEGYYRALGIAGGSTTSFVRFPVTVTPEDVMFGYFYFQYPEPVSASVNIFALRPNASSSSLGLAVTGTGAPGGIRLVGSGGVVLDSSPNNSFIPGVNYRVTLRIWRPEGTTGREFDLQIYEMGTKSTPVYGAVGVLPSVSDVAWTYLDVGKINNSPTSNPFVIDELYFQKSEIEEVSQLPTMDLWSSYEFFMEDQTDFWFYANAEEQFDGEMQGTAISVVPGSLNLAAEYEDPPPMVYEVNQIGGDTGSLEFNAPASFETEYVIGMTYFSVNGETWPSASFGLITFRTNLSNATVSATISGAAQPGQVRLVAVGGVQLATSPNNTIRLNTWYRLELQISAVSGRARVGVFALGTSRPLWASDWLENANFSSPVEIVQIGRVTTSPSVTGLQFDRVNIGGFLGPELPPGAPEELPAWYGPDYLLDPLPDYRLFAWDGTNYPRVGNGALLKAKDVEGSTWEMSETIRHAYLWDGDTLYNLIPRPPEIE